MNNIEIKPQIIVTRKGKPDERYQVRYVVRDLSLVSKENTGIIRFDLVPVKLFDMKDVDEFIRGIQYTREKYGIPGLWQIVEDIEINNNEFYKEYMNY